MMEMHINAVYTVTRDSDDGTFIQGDRIVMTPDGDISLLDKIGGWIPCDKVSSATKGIGIELDTAWLERQKKMLTDKLAWLNRLN